MKNITLIAAFIFTTSSFANYQLALNGKKVVCSADDSISVTLNAGRTTLKYMVEGESNGPQKIIKVISNNRDTVTYVAKELTLTLSDHGDSAQYLGEQDAMTFNECK